MSSIIKGLISELNPDLQKRLAARKAGQITSFDKPIAEPKAPASPVAPAPKSDVNPELQKRLAARKAGKPVYSGGLEEGADRQAELEMALQKARQITKQIKYDDTATDIIVQIQMLAEKFNIDKDSLESAIDDVYNAKNQLESAVYGLDEVFEEALQQSRWDDDEILDENLRKWFKEKWVRFGPDGKIRGDCARGDDSEGKPKCLPQSKAHSLGKKGRASAAARKRREDPNPERSGKAINVNTKKKTDEEQLDEKCWDTHKQVGMKSKGGKMVPNCVPKESVEEGHQQCPECGGAMYEAEMMNEKKDACYYKVKSRYKVWPSAYASGALVKCRKKGASNWGTGGKKNEGIEEDTAYAGGMGQGGNAGQSYRKYKVKPSGIAQGISETEAVNRNDGDGWHWYDIKPAGQ
jgi:hypothetical protein